MSKSENFFTEYWKKKESPLVQLSSESLNLSNIYANEINCLLALHDYDGGPVFETGCGDGSVFEHLNINKDDYTGIDISQPMLDTFLQKFPNANIQHVDGINYQYDKNKKYSLIFSTGVVQYFNPTELTQYIENSLKHLNDNGTLLIVNSLNKKDRFHFFSKYYSNHKYSVKSLFKYKVLALLSPLKLDPDSKSMGYWYSANFFRRLAKKNNCELKVYGSILQPFRISVGFKKKND